MPDPRWSGPPELIALTFEVGSAVSVLANNLVWVTETANKELAMGLSAVNAFATTAHWQGLGALASMVAVTGLNAGLQTLVGWTAEKIVITQTAAEAYTAARSGVIPSLVSQTNRDEWTILNATNWLGQNTPGIVERDTEYFGEHWPHNSGIGWAYAGTLSSLVAGLAVPPPVASMGASTAAPAQAAEAVTQATTQSGMTGAEQIAGQVTPAVGQTTATPAGAGGQLSSLLQQPMSMVSSLTEPLDQVLKAPTQAIQGFTNLPQGLIQSMAGMFPHSGAADAAEAVARPALTGAGGIGAVPAAGGGGVGAFPGAGLTSYTRPTSSFEPETGGRPTSLRAGVLNAAEVRSPTMSTAMGGPPLPLSQAGMLARTNADAEKDAVTRARVVVAGDPEGPQSA